MLNTGKTSIAEKNVSNAYQERVHFSQSMKLEEHDVLITICHLLIVNPKINAKMLLILIVSIFLRGSSY